MRILSWWDLNHIERILAKADGENTELFIVLYEQYKDQLRKIKELEDEILELRYELIEKKGAA